MRGNRPGVAMNAWYLIYTKPAREDLAALQLERQDYEVYLPKLKVYRRRGGRRRQVIEPLFPRYLFIRLSDTTDNWGPIRSTIGVSGLVRFGMRAARIPGDLVSALRQRESGEGLHELTPKRLEPGQKVRIADGPFTGYEAVFCRPAAQDRVALLLQIAEKSLKIELERKYVESL